VLTEELERTRTEVTVPELPDLKSQYGMGPAASKIYGLTRGLSIGGYGEGNYRNIVDDAGGAKNRADWLRMVLYAGYKFSDRILFNTEIEFEHATTEETISSEGGSVSVEFAALDFFWRDEANLRAGLVLVPMGFLNEVHEPPFFFGVNRPEVERRIIPTTWRETGAGAFGTFLGENLRYKVYAITSLNAAGYQPSGLRDARQQGDRALAEDWAFVGRLDYTPLPGLLVGGSLFLGDAGQDQTLTGDMGTASLPDTFTILWDLHAEYEWRGLSLRSLFTMAHIDQAGALSSALLTVGNLDPGEAIASQMLGVYGEVAYDVLRVLYPETDMELEPFFRVEWLNTQMDMPVGFSPDKSQRLMVYTAGFSFKPIPNVVIKADYRNQDPEAGQAPDEFNLGVGFAF
jgi:hypothetical protein